MLAYIYIYNRIDRQKERHTFTFNPIYILGFASEMKKMKNSSMDGYRYCCFKMCPVFNYLFVLLRQLHQIMAKAFGR